MVDLEEKEITEEEPEFDLTHTVSDDDELEDEAEAIIVDPLAVPDVEIADEEDEEADLLPDMIQEGEEPEAL